MAQQPRPSSPPTGNAPRVTDISTKAAPDPRDVHFAQTFQEAGLGQELNSSWLARQGVNSGHADSRQRRHQILNDYYTEIEGNERRAMADGFLICNSGAELNAQDVVLRLVELCQELPNISLQYLGTVGGPLVLRCGAHFAVIEDPDDDNHDTQSVTVRALVRAANALLAKQQVPRRFVPLRSAPGCESYVAPKAPGAQRLWEAGLLQPLLLAEILEFCNWKRDELNA